MIKFTILAELVEPAFSDWLKEVSAVVPGFSVVESRGYWQGKAERSFQLSVLCDEQPQPVKLSALLLQLADRYRNLAAQQEVWVTRESGIALHIVKSPIVAAGVGVPPGV